MVEYATLVEELHIIAFTRRKSKFQNLPTSRRGPDFRGNYHMSVGAKSKIDSKIQISQNVFVYPTNTRLKPLYFWNAYRIARKILVASGQWLVTSQDPFETGLVGYWLKKYFKIPLQIQIHTDFLSPYFWRESLKNKIRVLLGKFLVKKADRVRAVSERIKKSLIASCRIPDSRIDILPIFVDVEKIKSTQPTLNLHEKYPQYRFIILMASRITREKNIGLAIQAMSEVVKRHPETLLLIVGDGPEKEKLKREAKQLEIDANVIFEPRTDNLVSYYKTADVFAITSNYEGYGLTIVEALAAGTPVIATDVGIAREAIRSESQGAVIPVGDVGALVKALLKFLDNPAVSRNSGGAINYPSKRAHLEAYKKSWQSCLAK